MWNKQLPKSYLEEVTFNWLLSTYLSKTGQSWEEFRAIFSWKNLGVWYLPHGSILRIKLCDGQNSFVLLFLHSRIFYPAFDSTSMAPCTRVMGSDRCKLCHYPQGVYKLKECLDPSRLLCISEAQQILFSFLNFYNLGCLLKKKLLKMVKFWMILNVWKCFFYSSTK